MRTDYLDNLVKIDEEYRKNRKRRTRRRNDALHKDGERRKTMNYQSHADKYKRIYRKKGTGRAVKEKGVKMPTQICANDRCTKGWVTAFGGRESFATAFVFVAT